MRFVSTKRENSFNGGVIEDAHKVQGDDDDDDFETKKMSLRQPPRNGANDTAPSQRMAKIPKTRTGQIVDVVILIIRIRSGVVVVKLLK